MCGAGVEGVRRAHTHALVRAHAHAHMRAHGGGLVGEAPQRRGVGVVHEPVHRQTAGLAQQQEHLRTRVHVYVFICADLDWHSSTDSCVRTCPYQHVPI